MCFNQVLATVNESHNSFVFCAQFTHPQFYLSVNFLKLDCLSPCCHIWTQLEFGSHQGHLGLPQCSHDVHPCIMSTGVKTLIHASSLPDFIQKYKWPACPACPAQILIKEVNESSKVLTKTSTIPPTPSPQTLLDLLSSSNRLVDAPDSSLCSHSSPVQIFPWKWVLSAWSYVCRSAITRMIGNGFQVRNVSVLFFLPFLV